MITKKMTPRNGTGPLHVLVIGRVSTPNQPASNIEAGYAYAERSLKDVWDGEVVIRRLGEQGSGMLVGRETIQEACALVEARWPDLVLMEDVSKSYRNPRWIYAFVQDCFDAGVRVIAPGDNVDTWDENWELMLGTAALRHGMHIPETRRRVRRTSSHTFGAGGMVFQARFGYRKLTKEEADAGTLGPKGLRLVRVPALTPVIAELRRLVVVERWGGARLAGWLNENGVPPPPGSEVTRWAGRLVLDLLRDPLLYGLRQFPKVRYEPRFRDGKHKRRKNADPQQVRYPELAHMTEAEWAEMTTALDEIGRGRGQFDRPAGLRSARYEVPRHKTVTPLQHARCGACKAFCYLSGTDVVKCKAALTHRPGGCWNHVQASCEAVRAVLVDVLLDRLGRHPTATAAMLDAAWEMVESARGRTRAAVGDLDREVADLHGQAERLANAIADGGKLEALVGKLKAVEKSLRAARAKRDEKLGGTPDDRFPASRDRLRVDPRAALLELARESYEFADLMRAVFPRLEIRPVQALDSGLVRPRAVITLDLTAWAGPAADGRANVPEEVTVGLFDPPVHIKHLATIVDLKRQKLARGEKASLSVLAGELSLNRMTVKRALGYAKLMEAEGSTDPYRVLSAPPPRASRWKPRRERVTRAVA